MLTVELFKTTVQMPGAFNFDLLIREAEALVNSTGTVVYRGISQGTITGADAASYRIYMAVIDDATVFQKAWRGLGRSLRLSWRSAGAAIAVSVGVEIAEFMLTEYWKAIGVGEGLDILSELTKGSPPPFPPGTGPKTRFKCSWDRDTRSSLMTFKAFEERRFNGAVKWLEGWDTMPLIGSMLGIGEVYRALAESMLLAMVAAYTATELDRAPKAGRVRTKRVRAGNRVRGRGRPKEGSGLEPRERGQWRKKHPEPV